MKKIFIFLVFASLLITKNSYCQKEQTASTSSNTLSKKANISKVVSVEGFVVPPTLVQNTFNIHDKNVIYIFGTCICCHPPCTGCGGGDNLPPVIFGVPRGDVVSKSAKVSKNGQALTTFVIRNNAVLKTPLMAVTGQKEVSKVDSKNFKTSQSTTGTGPKNPNGHSEAFIQEIFEAFTTGYTIGTKLDQTFGISDALSDWLIKHFPPKP